MTRISLVLALVALAFTIRDIGLRTIATYFRRIGWWWIAVVIFEAAITSLDAVAIRAFLSPEQAKVRLRSALLSQLAGRAVNAVTPSGNVGEAVKVSVLVDHVSQSRAVSTILLYNAVSFAVEVLIVAVAAPVMVLLVPMPTQLAWLMLITGGVCFAIALAIYALTRRGVLDSAARLGTRIPVPGLALVRGWIWKSQAPSRYLLSQVRYERWRDRLVAVDSKMHLSSGARARDRWLGIAAVTASRLTSMTLSLVILHAVGESITLGFVAAYTVGGFVIYMTSSLVPMGVGISEGGNYALFRALGENPARGVTLVLARRVTLIMYAAIGLVLVTASETVQRARERQAERAVSGSIAITAHAPIASPGLAERIVTATPPPAPVSVTKIAD
ncbi:MAG TPA: lysylphosphatidylglycerol synthase transmembrane domain-containing protein [Kofleriaceae bacterium]|nr:lysylphosphatidylglycerol synthase transmembrane domain-containing protein [Kofleriaceae bacterium]